MTGRRGLRVPVITTLGRPGTRARAGGWVQTTGPALARGLGWGLGRVLGGCLGLVVAWVGPGARGVWAVVVLAAGAADAYVAALVGCRPWAVRWARWAVVGRALRATYSTAAGARPTPGGRTGGGPGHDGAPAHGSRTGLVVLAPAGPTTSTTCTTCTTSRSSRSSRTRPSRTPGTTPSRRGARQ